MESIMISSLNEHFYSFIYSFIHPYSVFTYMWFLWWVLLSWTFNSCPLFPLTWLHFSTNTISYKETLTVPQISFVMPAFLAKCWKHNICLVNYWLTEKFYNCLERIHELLNVKKKNKTLWLGLWKQYITYLFQWKHTPQDKKITMIIFAFQW